ncbi:hypothetical protein PIB30_020642 [Stylosanthes scabra]|uniref:Uncharacterized protein n=1 Tax=Stylosanthes scabra TaxID=79078 RepID=A0ABU6U7H7_9FABA|nr:hypothetical protein [Stylosanthes scabra]
MCGTNVLVVVCYARLLDLGPTISTNVVQIEPQPPYCLADDLLNKTPYKPIAELKEVDEVVDLMGDDNTTIRLNETEIETHVAAPISLGVNESYGDEGVLNRGKNVVIHDVVEPQSTGFENINFNKSVYMLDTFTEITTLFDGLKEQDTNNGFDGAVNADACISSAVSVNDGDCLGDLKSKETEVQLADEGQRRYGSEYRAKKKAKSGNNA